MKPCPICGLEGGFHDSDDKNSKHAEHQVPRELLKESGWAKKVHDQWKWRLKQIALIAAELDEDKQAWCDVVGEDGVLTGERILVKGTKPIEVEEVTIGEPAELEVCGAPA